MFWVKRTSKPTPNLVSSTRVNRGFVQVEKVKLDEAVEVILDDILNDGYAADISALIKYVTETPIELANNSRYGHDDGPLFYCTYGITSFYTLVFADKAVTVEENYIGGPLSRASKRDYSVIRVYRKEFSPQLDLFKEVAPFALVGTINCTDVSPQQYTKLLDFMSRKVEAAKLELKKQAIANVLRDFS